MTSHFFKVSPGLNFLATKFIFLGFSQFSLQALRIEKFYLIWYLVHKRKKFENGSLTAFFGYLFDFSHISSIFPNFWLYCQGF
jgi:hypothetical protein